MLSTIVCLLLFVCTLKLVSTENIGRNLSKSQCLFKFSKAFKICSHSKYCQEKQKVTFLLNELRGTKIDNHLMT